MNYVHHYHDLILKNFMSHSSNLLAIDNFQILQQPDTEILKLILAIFFSFAAFQGPSFNLMNLQICDGSNCLSYTYLCLENESSVDAGIFAAELLAARQ